MVVLVMNKKRNGKEIQGSGEGRTRVIIGLVIVVLEVLYNDS